MKKKMTKIEYINQHAEEFSYEVRQLLYLMTLENHDDDAIVEYLEDQYPQLLNGYNTGNDESAISGGNQDIENQVDS